MSGQFSPVVRDQVVMLREVEYGDVQHFYHHQLDEAAAKLAAFPIRDWAEFEVHWRAILADAGVLKRTIIVSGEIAGNIVGFSQGSRREVGYWLDRRYWGRGIATTALRAFLELETTRPLFAAVAEHNIGSRRVLEKCGFVQVGHEEWGRDESGAAVLGLLYELASK